MNTSSHSLSQASNPEPAAFNPSGNPSSYRANSYRAYHTESPPATPRSSKGQSPNVTPIWNGGDRANQTGVGEKRFVEPTSRYLLCPEQRAARAADPAAPKLGLAQQCAQGDHPKDADDHTPGHQYPNRIRDK
ncbi:hypothetical protein PCH_Pc15g02130 [Penicillium rubens Wisconsin 54-1255]|uniref:Uncharacterized protein n=1 Tax=Penicillium rubens (strain ATCC 28089 / DSM 1075 / NRRL 1951 / Wisconsin 54-1255) TaxID=500485 RepID=B6H6E7_PENRW|nr:hypothetical protein PCH_Pc15g02130 [Penicillium rubens Wisconsin 54-1255]